MKRIWKTTAAVLGIVLLGAAGTAPLPAADPAPEGGLIVVDAAGKELKIKSWKIVFGIRPLGWLAEAPKPDPKDDPKAPLKIPAGPDAIEMRDDASLTPPVLPGVVTLIPLDRVRSIEFDDKDVMTVRVATDKADHDEVVSGSSKYRGVNKVTLEADVDKGDLGVASVKFMGGVPMGIKALRFPTPKSVAAAPAGRAATVVTSDMKKTAHKVTDLKPLYRVPEGERLLDALMFKKTLKIDLAKVSKIRFVAAAAMKGEGPEWAVTLKDGEETFTLLTQTSIDGKNATLEGLVGRVGAGFMLFPASTISEITFDDPK